jgi:hypothetical protein
LPDDSYVLKRTVCIGRPSDLMSIETASARVID